MKKLSLFTIIVFTIVLCTFAQQRDFIYLKNFSPYFSFERGGCSKVRYMDVDSISYVQYIPFSKGMNPNRNMIDKNGMPYVECLSEYFLIRSKDFEDNIFREVSYSLDKMLMEYFPFTKKYSSEGRLLASYLHAPATYRHREDTMKYVYDEKGWISKVTRDCLILDQGLRFVDNDTTYYDYSFKPFANGLEYQVVRHVRLCINGSLRSFLLDSMLIFHNDSGYVSVRRLETLSSQEKPVYEVISYVYDSQNRLSKVYMPGDLNGFSGEMYDWESFLKEYTWMGEYCTEILNYGFNRGVKYVQSLERYTYFRNGKSVLSNLPVSEPLPEVQLTYSNGMIDISVFTDKKFDVAVYNQQGQTVSIKNGNIYQSSVSIMNEPKGIYFVRLMFGKEFITKKVLKR